MCLHPANTLQAWYATHPPKRGEWWMGTRPFVHQGFLKSWTANGLNANIVERCVVAVRKMLKESYGAPIKAYITGAFMLVAWVNKAGHWAETMIRHHWPAATSHRERW